MSRGYDSHGGGALGISALKEITIGAQKNTLKRRDELSYDALNEYDQQIQLVINGTAGSVASYVAVTVNFDVYFIAGTLQRANNLIWPHFTYGSILHTASPILIWANVMSWILDGAGDNVSGNNTVVGARIQWGSMAPDLDFGAAPISFTGALHLNFQGLGAPPDVGVDATGEVPITVPSSPSTPSSPPPPPPSGDILFDGERYSSWPLDQSAVTGGGALSRVQEVADPGGGNDIALRFTTLDTDTNTPIDGNQATPTFNPRSQLVSPNVFEAGQTYWTSGKLWIPAGSPIIGSTSWVGLGTPDYGPPFDGSSPTGLSVDYIAGYKDLPNGVYLGWEEDAQYSPDPNGYKWTTPIGGVVNRWVTLTWQVTMSDSGAAALYVDSNQVASISTGALDSSDDEGPWNARLSLYYALGQFPQATVYFKKFKIATTQAAAESN